MVIWSWPHVPFKWLWLSLLFPVQRKYVTENKMRLTQSASTCVQAQLTMQMSQKYKPGSFRGADNFQFDQVWYSLDSDSFPD
jgi:hypothetical protein